MTPHSGLFPLYQQTLVELLEQHELEVVLRRFELQLLDALGYGYDFATDAVSGETVVAEGYYRFDPEQGCHREMGDPAGCFPGESLLAIASGDFSKAVRPAAKRICRMALQPLLGDKPLKSRELFQ